MGRPWAAYAALLGLLFPSTFSILLLTATLRGWHSSEGFADTVTNEKPSIAIVVQMASHTLGLFQICALCSIISLSFQQRASSTPFSLNLLRFVNSAFALRYDWNLPFLYLLPLVLFIAFSLVPAAIWSGAITPNVVSKNITAPFSIPLVAKVNHSENPLFPRSAGQGTCDWLGRGAQGQGDAPATFHDCLDKLAILQSAASSSSQTEIPGVDGKVAAYHTKLDRSGYYFVGRSYGTGGTVGLVELPEVQKPTLYSFTETGLQLDVECIVNRSAAYKLEYKGEHEGFRYWADLVDGVLPGNLSAKNGAGAVHLARLDLDVFSWVAAYDPKNRTAWFALAAPETPGCDPLNPSQKCGYGFSELNQTQCRIDFTPREFHLSVNTQLRVITVTPGKPTEWPSYAGDLLDEIIAEHNNIAKTDSSLGGSQLGHAIRSNIAVLRSRRNETAFSEKTMLNGVEEFITDSMDNVLMSFSQTQYFSDKSRRVVDAEVSRNVAVYGKPKFVHAAVCLNFLIVAICVVEAVRTRFWKGICTVDLLDPASIAVASSHGGLKLAAHMQTIGATGLLLPVPRSSVQEVSGKVRVRLRDINGSMSAIEPADGSYNDEGEAISLSGVARQQSSEDAGGRKYMRLPTREAG